MSNWFVIGVPVLLLFLLALFAKKLFAAQSSSVQDKGGDTEKHSDRIYKDFEMYLKVMLGLTAAFGFIRLDRFEDSPELARTALQVLGGISLLVMVVFCIFIICHQGSKIRRWKEIEWEKAIYWQELWACLSMWVFSCGLWVAASKW